MGSEEFMKVFKKRIEPLIAIGILICLVILINSIHTDIKLKQEIAENCGWGDEDIYCSCKNGFGDVVDQNFVLNLEDIHAKVDS